MKKNYVRLFAVLMCAVMLFSLVPAKANAVALDGENLRSALDEAIKRIDRELERKLEEFGRLKDGQLTEPFIVPDINTVKEWLE
mgnify:CR=1 FL=1